MRKIILTIALMPLLLLAQEYKLVWEDNFDGPEINAANWNLEDNARGGGNAELQYYTPHNASIEKHPVTGESCLVISAKRENYNNRPATSARLNTQDKVTVKYGKIEVRIAFPKTADGLWPAFWMLGNDLATNLGNNDDIDKQKKQLKKQGRVLWPKCGEIDIVEMGHSDGIKDGKQDRFFNGAAHWGEDFNGGNYPNDVSMCTTNYSLQNNFHLFTVIWDKEKIEMYLDLDKHPDEKPYFTLDLTKKKKNEPGRYFCKPFYFVVNLAVGGFFPDMPAAEKYPAVITANDPSFQKVTALPTDGSPVKMYVDYIKVFKLK